ncbi:unnamed protein product [Lathyrus oleraceus]
MESSNALIQKFEINMIGSMTDCNFYIPDVTGDSTGLAFRVAFREAMYASNNNKKEICAYVGSMLCSVVPGFRNSVEAALNGASITPHFVSLPSQACENKIDISHVPELDRSSILVAFGYCILLLFKIDIMEEVFIFNTSHLFNFNTIMAKRIVKLQEKVGRIPNKYIGIPFHEDKVIAIRTMLGTHGVRTSVINFLMNNLSHSDSKISSLCHHLSYVLSWSGDMRVFTVMNKWLLKTESTVLSGNRVRLEVDNLEVTIKAIASKTYPQYFSHLCLPSELFHLDVSRFPNLFAVAVALDQGLDDGEIVSLCYDIPGSNSLTACELLKRHRKAMDNNIISTRDMPTIPGI